jgi:hypothetical protein
MSHSISHILHAQIIPENATKITFIWPRMVSISTTHHHTRCPVAFKNRYPKFLHWPTTFPKLPIFVFTRHNAVTNYPSYPSIKLSFSSIALPHRLSSHDIAELQSAAQPYPSLNVPALLPKSNLCAYAPESCSHRWGAIKIYFKQLLWQFLTKGKSICSCLVG